MSEEPSGYKPNGSYKVFPIDYSLNELGTKWNVDPRTIKKYVLNNNYLKKPLSDLSKSLTDLDQEKQPLAVETEPFLKSFFKLATSTKDFKALCQGKERKPGSRSKISKMFCYKLCVNMCRDICAPSETDDIDATKFCRRVLFRNDKFSAAVMRQEWSSQIKLRIDQIQQLSQTIPAEQQVLTLQDCLMELDHICLTLIQANQIDAASPAQTLPDPQELLNDLLAERKKDFQMDTKTYLLHDISVPVSSEAESISLGKVFRHLNCTKYPDPELMKQARTSYQKHLTDRIIQSDFESNYLELLEYLKFTSNDWSEDELRKRITESMKRACIPTICKCCNYPYDHLPLNRDRENLSTDYFSVFLTKECTERIQTALDIFSDTFECISLVNEIYARLDHLVQHRDKWPENTWNAARYNLEEGIRKNIVAPFPRWFARMWIFIAHENVDLSNAKFWIDELTGQWIKDRYPEFLRMGLSAVNYFGYDAEFVVCCKIFTNPQFQNDLIRIFNSLCNSLIFGACLILKRLIEDTSPEVAENAILFRHCQQNATQKKEARSQKPPTKA